MQTVGSMGRALNVDNVLYSTSGGTSQIECSGLIADVVEANLHCKVAHRSVHRTHLAHTIMARALKVRSSCLEAASHMQAHPSRPADSRKVLSRDQSRSFTASS